MLCGLAHTVVPAY